MAALLAIRRNGNLSERVGFRKGNGWVRCSPQSSANREIAGERAADTHAELPGRHRRREIAAGDAPFLDQDGNGEADKLAVEAVQHDRKGGEENHRLLHHRPGPSSRTRPISREVSRRVSAAVIAALPSCGHRQSLPAVMYYRQRLRPMGNSAATYIKLKVISLLFKRLLLTINGIVARMGDQKLPYVWIPIRS